MFGFNIPPPCIFLVIASLNALHLAYAFTFEPSSSVTRPTPSPIRTSNHICCCTPAPSIIQKKKLNQQIQTILFASSIENVVNDDDNELYLQAKDDSDSYEKEEEVDIAIVGAGIGGLCAGAILNTLYDKKVAIYESHYLPGV